VNIGDLIGEMTVAEKLIVTLLVSFEVAAL
jgi:hypothetical protein